MSLQVFFQPLYCLQDSTNEQSNVVPSRCHPDESSSSNGDRNLAGLYSSILRLCFPDHIGSFCSVFYQI